MTTPLHMKHPDKARAASPWPKVRVETNQALAAPETTFDNNSRGFLPVASLAQPQK